MFGVAPIFEYIKSYVGMGPQEDYSECTEIRAEEKSRGGMSYEVILSPSVTDRPPTPPSGSLSPSSPRLITQQDIDHKLEQAEIRRKTIEAERVASISERLCRLEEAARKRQEVNEEFITTTAAALDLKLDAISANREAHLDGLRAKVVDHLKSVEAVRTSTETQTAKLREDILAKMSNAQENRDDYLRSIMEKLQAHELSVQRVRMSHEKAVEELDERIRTKQCQANENRQAELQRKLDSLRQHFEKISSTQAAVSKKEEDQCQKTLEKISKYEQKIEKLESNKPEKNVLQKVEMVKNAKEIMLETRTKEIEERIKTKLIIAEKKKAEMAEQALQAKEEQERRAKKVRENKKSISASNSAEEISASSG